MLGKIILSLSLLALFFAVGEAIECKDPSGNAVDYFSILRFPRKIQEDPDTTNKYVYYDSTTSSKSFKMRPKYVDDNQEPLARLLSDLNTNLKSLDVIAWNDGFFSSTKGTAHSKGVIAYDPSSNKGIYLLHSTPDFPNFKTNKFDELIPDNNRIYGQSFLCMSLTGETLESIAEGLLLENIEIYHQDFTTNGLPNLANLAKGNSNKTPGSTSVTFKTALKGVEFKAFFKNSHDTSIFLYEDVIVPGLKTSLFVESWGRPYMESDCSLSGGKFTKNVISIKVPGDAAGWERTQDHSKWAISASESTPYVCLGDMNRQQSQANRGGGAFCVKNSGLWSSFNSLIENFEDCKRNTFLEA